MEQLIGSKLWKQCDKAICCHPAYLTYMNCTTCEILGWMNHKLDSTAGRNIKSLRYADDITLMAESEEELKSFLMKVKEESEKAGLKLNIQKTKIMVSGPITSWQIKGEKVEAVTVFSWAPKSLHMVTAAMKLKDVAPWKESYDQPGQRGKKQRHHFADKGPWTHSFGFPVVMYRCELDHKEGWAPKNWSFQIVLEKTLESPLDCKEIKPVHQPWIFIGRTDAATEAAVLWPLDAKSWLSGKHPDALKGWRQKEKGAAKDETVRQHYWLSGCESERLWEAVGDRGAWCAAVHGVSESCAI